eukprot:jgi/Botrbrau1/8581/Bobra.0380s0004.1
MEPHADGPLGLTSQTCWQLSTRCLSCSGYIFRPPGQDGVACNTFKGDLYLIFVQPTETPGPMRMGEGLASLGLNSISLLNGSLFIVNAGSAGPVSITPFLPRLTSTFGIFVQEPYNYYNNLPFLFPSLPLQSVRYISVLSLSLTGLVDMSSFSALQCIGLSLGLSNNPALDNLGGLGQLSFIDPFDIFYRVVNTSSVFIQGNALLNTPAKFAALTNAAKCVSGSPTNILNITIPDCPSPILSYSQLCSYIAGSNPCPSI